MEGACFFTQALIGPMGYQLPAQAAMGVLIGGQCLRSSPSIGFLNACLDGSCHLLQLDHPHQQSRSIILPVLPPDSLLDLYLPASGPADLACVLRPSAHHSCSRYPSKIGFDLVLGGTSLAWNIGRSSISDWNSPGGWYYSSLGNSGRLCTWGDHIS